MQNRSPQIPEKTGGGAAWRTEFSKTARVKGKAERTRYDYR